jgi:hypothetical protein
LNKKLSSSKGLLKLGVAGIKPLGDPGVMQSLMGDRYDQLRLVSIDWGSNSDFTEKSVKILTENILANCRDF